MRLNNLHLTLFLILCLLRVEAQPDYSGTSFILPLDVRPSLSGTFGELRSNHFHSGIDFKTEGKVGKPVYAIEDGYVSRIKVSPGGFGNTLYVNHEEGYTSVYAHLQDFRGDLAEYVRLEQYRRESYEVDLYLGEGQFLVSQGEIIARSGNSGYSFGPHLHFEIREASTQVPINPLLFNLRVKDEISPKIKKLKIYPESHETLINGEPEPLVINVAGYGTRHHLVGMDTIRVQGRLSFGLLTYDLLNGAANKNGIYEMKIRFDGSLVYHLRMEKFAFSETRYINSLIDYAEYRSNKERFIRSRLDPNNRLNIYEEIIDDGVISITDSDLHDLMFEVVDIYGNRAALQVLLQGVGANSFETGRGQKENYQLVSWRDESTFEADGIELFFPAYAFYDNIHLKYEKRSKTTHTFSALHHIGDDKIPVHKYLTLSIRPEEAPAELNEKLLLARMNGDGDRTMSASGGTYQDGWVKGRIREFGIYSVALDTIPPQVKSLNVRAHQNVSTGQRLKFRIKDDFSGIKSYRGTMNDEWVLMQYDAKNDLLYYIVDDRTRKGLNRFRLEIHDEKDNLSVFEAELKL